MHVKISVTVKTVDGMSLCDGGKLEDSEGYNYFFVVSMCYNQNRSALVPDLL